MTVLSLTRLAGINKGIRNPGPVTRYSIIKMASIITMICAASLAIATMPLVDYFEDFFVNGMAYDQKMRLFIGSANKDTHFAVLEVGA